MKTKKRKKTTGYEQADYWTTTLLVEDELVDRVNIWHFYSFAAAIFVPLLRDFRNVAEFTKEPSKCHSPYSRPEEPITVSSFDKMINSINLLIRYYNEGGLTYRGRKIDFERGDRIRELTEALHQFVNILPYLNSRHFILSKELYDNAPDGRHCDFDELCNLDKTIAKRLFLTLKTFASMSVFTPQYFKDMYYSYWIPDSVRTRDYNVCDKWDEALKAMVESWRWILERKPAVTDDGWENVPERIYYGLHLFAEYLPEMQND